MACDVLVGLYAGGHHPSLLFAPRVSGGRPAKTDAAAVWKMGFGLACPQRSRWRRRCYAATKFRCRAPDAPWGWSGRLVAIHSIGVCSGRLQVFPTHLRVEALDEELQAFCRYVRVPGLRHTPIGSFGTGDEYRSGYVLCGRCGACLCRAGDSFCSGVHTQFSQVLCALRILQARCVVGNEDDRYIEFFFSAVEAPGIFTDGEGRVDYAVRSEREGIGAWSVHVVWEVFLSGSHWFSAINRTLLDL